MKRFRYQGGLGKAVSMLNTVRSRGGTWTRIAKHHKQVHLQCAQCGAVVDLETDHIVPLHRGGTNAWSNLQSLCKSCHVRKSALEAGDRVDPPPSPRGGIGP